MLSRATTTALPGPVRFTRPVSAFAVAIVGVAETNRSTVPVFTVSPKLSSAAALSSRESPTAVTTVSDGLIAIVFKARTKSRAVSANPPEDATIRVESPPTAVASPLPLTVATDVTVDDHPTVPATMFPAESFRTAVYWTVAGSAMVSTFGVRMT